MERRITPWRILGRLLRAFFVLMILAVNVFVLWRIFSMRVPSEMKTLMVNEATYAAYETEGRGMEMFTQEQNDITRADNNAGYFSVKNATFLPGAAQVQIVFRYNNSTLRSVAEDYALEKVPGREEELFDVTLLLTTDRTPDDASDNNAVDDPQSVGTQRLFPSAVKSYRKGLYNYRKYIFDGVSVGEDTLGVFVDIYYCGDLDYDKTPYGTLCIYDYETKNDPVKLTKNDIRALEDWREAVGALPVD